MLDELDDETVIIPKNDIEHEIIMCFTLSLKGTMSGVECDYMVVKDFAKLYDHNVIELYQKCKNMSSVFNDNIKNK